MSTDNIRDVDISEERFQKESLKASQRKSCRHHKQNSKKAEELREMRKFEPEKRVADGLRDSRKQRRSATYKPSISLL